VNLRVCVSCHVEKPENQFERVRNGLRERCRSCALTRRGRLGNDSLESHLKRVSTLIKHRAKKQGTPFNLSSDVLLSIWKEQDGKCALSGAPLTHHRRNEMGSTRKILNSPTNVSVDRISPAGPYSRENVMLVCALVNIMRRNMQVDEFVMWCRMISDHERSRWG